MDNNVEQIAQAAEDARRQLDFTLGRFRTDWAEWQEQNAVILKDFRLWRMAMESESHQAVKAFEVATKIYLSPQQLERTRQLTEFVTVMERLHALEQSGFLDRLGAAFYPAQSPTQTPT